MVTTSMGDVRCRVDTVGECKSESDGENECEFGSFGLGREHAGGVCIDEKKGAWEADVRPGKLKMGGG